MHWESSSRASNMAAPNTVSSHSHPSSDRESYVPNHSLPLSFTNHYHHSNHNVHRHNPYNLPRNHDQFLPPLLSGSFNNGFPRIAPEVYVSNHSGLFPSHPIHPNSINFTLPPPPPPFLEPPSDPTLYIKIKNQIEYYFSYQNLVKDLHLRSKMDNYGWVAISIVADFNRVKNLTHNVNLILDALLTSDDVEVKGHRIRKRYDWKRWTLPPNFQLPSNENTSTQQYHVQQLYQGMTFFFGFMIYSFYDV